MQSVNRDDKARWYFRILQVVDCNQGGLTAGWVRLVIVLVLFAASLWLCQANGHRAILETSHNCWRRENAQRVAIAIDGAAYFRAVREAILAARHSVFIIGWDIHSKLKLVRDSDADGFPEELGALLDFVAKQRGVDVYVLSWDFAMIYLIERETLPLYALNWKTHSRVRFHMDDKHPVGASQHQKIVVVDDAVAFSGGLDLSKWRWDTPEHAYR